MQIRVICYLFTFSKYLDLSALPSPGKTTPMIHKTRGAGPITQTRQIRNIVQVFFDKSIERLQIDGFKNEVEILATATVH